MAGLGISGDVIDECLNHMIESRVRRTYIRDRRALEQARAFDALGQMLALLIPADDQKKHAQQRLDGGAARVECNEAGAATKTVA